MLNVSTDPCVHIREHKYGYNLTTGIYNVVDIKQIRPPVIFAGVEKCAVRVGVFPVGTVSKVDKQRRQNAD